ncbi:hypothetical protein [Methanogenium cariaci]|uniref:hypothetical protein n=1 Tax=Methanogenium cariaci TaxID=2197 RepID=UPI0007867F8F|nr:hypothetical protein [Methanogenium cariaci]
MLDALAEAKKKIVLLSSVTRHDILNQVSVILMCDELVRGDTGLAPLTQEQADHYWDMANAAARTVGRLISFTSDYDALGMEPPPRWQNLATVVRNVETLLHGAGVSVNLACGGKLRSLPIRCLRRWPITCWRMCSAMPAGGQTG